MKRFNKGDVVKLLELIGFVSLVVCLMAGVVVVFDLGYLPNIWEGVYE